MFYGQCNDCGERWKLGTASSCKCPDELPAYTFKPPSEPVSAFLDTGPNHNITFHNGGKQVGALDFNGPEMVFTGDADESAKVFFDYIATAFKARLEQERADERNSWPAEMEAMERQVNILTDALAEERERMKWDVHSCGPTCKRYACVAMREAVEAEREACAKVCDWYVDYSSNPMNFAENCAQEIRARGSNT